MRSQSGTPAVPGARPAIQDRQRRAGWVRSGEPSELAGASVPGDLPVSDERLRLKVDWREWEDDGHQLPRRPYVFGFDGGHDVRPSNAVADVSARVRWGGRTRAVFGLSCAGPMHPAVRRQAPALVDQVAHDDSLCAIRLRVSSVNMCAASDCRGQSRTKVVM